MIQFRRGSAENRDSTASLNLPDERRIVDVIDTTTINGIHLFILDGSYRRNAVQCKALHRTHSTIR